MRKLDYLLNASASGRLSFILFHSNLLTTRFLLALSEFAWAVALFWVGDTFDRQTYAAMASVMSENLWGLLFLTSSITQMYILLSGRFHDNFAVIYAGFNTLMWWYVTLCMYLSVFPPPAAISSELALTIGASLVFLRSGYQKVIKEK